MLLKPINKQTRLLFHYSKVKFNVLKTRNKQLNLSLSKSTLLSPQEIDYDRNAWDYMDHISFFLEPIPIDIVGDIYGDSHPVWHNGNLLYQYTVSARELFPANFRIAETNEVNELLIDCYSDKITIEELNLERIKIEKKFGYMGNTYQGLEKVIDRYLGTTKESFIKQPKMPWWNDSKNKYAAGVPHLMIYPFSGTVKILETTRVMIGEKRQ